MTPNFIRPTTLIAVLAVSYCLAAWCFVLPGYHLVRGELKRIYYGEPQDRPNYQQKVENFRNQQAELEKSKVILLGDSITEGLDASLLRHTDSVFNMGISGDTTVGMINRLSLLDNVRNQKVIVLLMIGVNDLGMNLTVDKIVENIEIILNYFEGGESYVVIQEIIYTDGRKRDNKKISNLNDRLEYLSHDRSIPIIQINSRLAKEKELHPEFTYDGIHLNHNGYKEWASIINKQIKKWHEG